jgi:hypothetical protein
MHPDSDQLDNHVIPHQIKDGEKDERRKDRVTFLNALLCSDVDHARATASHFGYRYPGDKPAGADEDPPIMPKQLTGKRTRDRNTQYAKHRR